MTFFWVAKKIHAIFILKPYLTLMQNHLNCVNLNLKTTDNGHHIWPFIPNSPGICFYEIFSEMEKRADTADISVLFFLWLC